MQEFKNEPRFDDRSQQEIIALAARLQREANQSMSLSELERIAMEAGIEPRFVRQAAMRHAEETEPIRTLAPMQDVIGPSALLALAAVFTVQVGVVWTLLSGEAKVNAVLIGGAVAIAFGKLAPALGRSSRYGTYLPLLATIFSIVALTIARSSVVHYGNFQMLGLFTAVQCLIAFITHWLSHNRVSAAVASRKSRSVI
ncbi:hypothetical protein [Fimbriimonas ginsengisoli]|uniref:Uncharacterized protein n=1 Tax=Fimbriimonas ginsengisoli Gsoil 348 TaxID=661478 RepID=A0A068NT06_FIMGI|nr:hypothetical protein [Fimbriimonas ginsengisoli]AIE86482.1 hypothetical protein OP10G_3114 [Fimbriimonas ginsengisoli Gsoil 348]